MVKRIDAYLTSYFPILVASYFIYNNSFFATHIFMVCWLSMAINMTFSLETYNTTLTTKNSLISILNLLLFGSFAVLGYISIEGFLLSIIIGENTALIIAIIYAFIFRKGVNSENSWKTFGVRGTIGFIILFTATIYPYLGEWIIYLTDNVEVVVIVGAIISFVVNISRKIKTLDQIMERRRKMDLGSIGDQLEKAKDTSKMSAAAINILVSLGIWFFGVGVIYAIYVHNA
jgi:hypothetical protein